MVRCHGVSQAAAWSTDSWSPCGLSLSSFLLGGWLRIGCWASTQSSFAVVTVMCLRGLHCVIPTKGQLVQVFVKHFQQNFASNTIYNLRCPWVASIEQVNRYFGFAFIVLLAGDEEMRSYEYGFYKQFHFVISRDPLIKTDILQWPSVRAKCSLEEKMTVKMTCWL